MEASQSIIAKRSMKDLMVIESKVVVAGIERTVCSSTMYSILEHSEA
jgi:hypothetical protein